MQRWIVIGVISMALLAGGAYFTYKTYQANRPGPIWVPLVVPDELSKEHRDQACRELQALFEDDARAIAIVRDMQLAHHWSMKDDVAAAKELRRRIFIRQGSTGAAHGNRAAINIGLQGKQKDKPLTEKTVMRMMVEVRKAMTPSTPPAR